MQVEGSTEGTDTLSRAQGPMLRAGKGQAKKVSFADSLGQPLAQVHLFEPTEADDSPREKKSCCVVF